MGLEKGARAQLRKRERCNDVASKEWMRWRMRSARTPQPAKSLVDACVIGDCGPAWLVRSVDLRRRRSE